MDVDKLLNALDNESNSRLINMDTTQIENMKRDILKELELNDENYNDYLKKLKEYIYIDELNDLKEGGFIRWIQLNSDDIYLTQGGIFCETLITDEGIKLVCKNFARRHFEIMMEDCLIFQKLSGQELVLLSALDYLSEK